MKHMKYLLFIAFCSFTLTTTAQGYTPTQANLEARKLFQDMNSECSSIGAPSAYLVMANG